MLSFCISLAHSAWYFPTDCLPFVCSFLELAFYTDLFHYLQLLLRLTTSYWNSLLAIEITIHWSLSFVILLVYSILLLKITFYETVLDSDGLFKCMHCQPTAYRKYIGRVPRFFVALFCSNPPPPHRQLVLKSCTIGQPQKRRKTKREVRKVLSRGSRKIRRQQRSECLFQLFFQHRTVFHVTGYSAVSHCQNILLNLNFRKLSKCIQHKWMNRSRGVFAVENWKSRFLKYFAKNHQGLHRSPSFCFKISAKWQKIWKI